MKTCEHTNCEKDGEFLIQVIPDGSLNVHEYSWIVYCKLHWQSLKKQCIKQEINEK